MSVMCRVSRNFLVVLAALCVPLSAWSTPADDAKEMLARAEALYYEADFAKSIELLLRADELLKRESGELQDRLDIKLQLALSFIGLNDRGRAKTYLGELYALDSDHQIDPQVFSPKVIQLAEEARTEQAALRCQSLLDEAQRQLGTGNPEAVIKVTGSNPAKCAGLAALNPKVAELFYKEGLDAYKKAQMEQALQKFRNALRAEPKHELAAQYLELTESKLQVAADRAILDWRKDFAAGQYASAIRDYRDVVARSRSETIEEVRAEYRRALAPIVDSWNRACSTNDVAGMEDARQRANALLPETSFAEDIIAKMKKCTPTGCLQMTAPLALARLKTRVDPQFPPYVISQLRVSPITVRIKARISEAGDIVSSEPQGGNPIVYGAVREAVNQWKFFPALTDGDARCVDTEIPIVINVNGK